MKEILLVLVLMVFSIPVCQAEIVNIVETAEYTMKDSETKNDASLHCIDLARRAASERAGIYIEAYAKTEDNILTENIVKAVSASIMKDRVKPIVKTTLTEDGNIHLAATVDVEIDTDEISELINKVKEDRQYQEDYEKILNKCKELEKENSHLKEENDCLR